MKSAQWIKRCTLAMLKLQVFLKFLQNSQETIGAGVSFLIKVSGWRLEAPIFTKIHASAGAFPWTLHKCLRTSIPSKVVHKMKVLGHFASDSYLGQRVD